jgi:NitT/TauT family transport system permease protein
MTEKSLWRSTARARVVLIFATCAVLLWELAVKLFEIPVYLIPAPTSVLGEIYRNPGLFWGHTYHTLLATVLGFALAVVIGVALAVLIVSSRLAEQTIYLVLVALNSIPKVAVAPLFIIWVGTGFSSKVTMAAVISVFAIVIDTVLGLRSVDPDLLDLSRSLGGRRLGILMKIRFPTALPSLFAGMKVAISLALVGTIVGEFVAASSGLGYVIMTAQTTFDTGRIFAALLILAVMGTLLFFLIDVLERWLLPWHVSQRHAS